MKDTKDNHAKRLSKKLNRLREKREEADYELTAKEFGTQEVEDILVRCERLCDEVRNRVPERLMQRIGEELQRRVR